MGKYTTSIYLTDLKVLTIGPTTVDCGETNGVTIGDTYFVEGDGQSPGVNCTYTFTCELDASCQGLCYNMTNDSFFRDELATLTITSGSYSKVRRITNYQIFFANNLDSDQARQNVGPDLDPNCLTLRSYS